MTDDKTAAERLRAMINRARQSIEGNATLSRTTLPVADVEAILDEIDARHADDVRRSEEGRTDWDYEKRLAHPQPEIVGNEWSELQFAERQRQIAKGYDAAHDDTHGIDHLLMWADDYLRRGKRIEVSGLITAARELLLAAHPDRTAVLHVSTAPDMETRAELFNEGYEAAMAQHLADDPSAAEDWLAKHDAVIWAEAARITRTYEPFANPVTIAEEFEGYAEGGYE